VLQFIHHINIPERYMSQIYASRNGERKVLMVFLSW
jgi:hypothetical protein